MKTLRKTKKCLNCNQSLSEVYRYCPLCGQENTDNNVSFRQLIGDFFSNYFSLDSKFFRSIKPFFIQPGKLTTSFNEGKRKSYANPVRLYIIISFIYFFVLSFFATDLSDSMKLSDNDQLSLDSLTTEVITRIDSVNTQANLPFDSLINDKLKIDINKITEEEYKYQFSLEDTTSTKAISISIDTTSGWPLSSQEWSTFFKIKDSKSLSNQNLYDSLHIKSKSVYTQYLIKQMIKVYKTDKEYVFAFIIKNFSLMMFFMLPVFAAILKILYIRKEILYINHLVHTIHIHSFAFLIYAIALSYSIWINESDWMILIALAIVSAYSYFSFKTVYRQSYKKTLMKFAFTGFFYSFFMLFAFLIELLLSFLIF